MEKIVYKILRNFKPKLQFNDLEGYLHYFDEIDIENSTVYSLAQDLVSTAIPTYEDQYDKRWEYFYIPIKKCRRNFAVPLWIMEYNKEFFITIQSYGRFHIKTGNKKIEKFFCDILSETIRFIPIIKKYEILEEIIPYNIRTGKIKGRYVLEKLLSRCRKEKILKAYKNHINKHLHIKEISLNEYLQVASICYKAAYGDKNLTDISNLDMYKRWADGRDGGMLSIKDWDSKNEFAKWYHSGEHIGAHPFEIVFSWHEHGIHLYPPDYLPCYGLRIRNYAYAWDFLKMVDTLIKMNIPFNAENLVDVLDFVTGKTYFNVNKGYDHSIKYYPSAEYEQKYLPHIKWDDIKIVKWNEK